MIFFSIYGMLFHGMFNEINDPVNVIKNLFILYNSVFLIVVRIVIFIVFKTK